MRSVLFSFQLPCGVEHFQDATAQTDSLYSFLDSWVAIITARLILIIAIIDPGQCAGLGPGVQPVALEFGRRPYALF